MSAATDKRRTASTILRIQWVLVVAFCVLSVGVSYRTYGLALADHWVWAILGFMFALLVALEVVRSILLRQARSLETQAHRQRLCDVVEQAKGVPVKRGVVTRGLEQR